jgi:NADPH:quinone reductase-like Zn-dependent oxidoreductase
MKAAVIFQKGELPRYAEFPEPVVQNDNEILMNVRAAAIKHFDKGKASGKHYASPDGAQQAAVIGGDGVGLLTDGTRVFALGVGGMIAEKSLIEKNTIVKLPEGIEDATAAALPNAVAGSAMALRFRARMKPGDTVLINGATGFTGKIAVQIAKYYGAGKIIVTGRNEKSLQSLPALGADEIISLRQEEGQLISQLKELHHRIPVDIVLDYLWGPIAECILSSFRGDGSFTRKIRFVSVGSVTGDKIQLPAEILRSVNLRLSGSGLGSWTRDEMQLLFSQILPEMFDLAATGRLKVDTEQVRLADIETLWTREVTGGKRLVITL